MVVRHVVHLLFFACCLLAAGDCLAESKKKQREIDDNLLTAYFAQNNIKATKTNSGLYYTINKPGHGKNAFRGQRITMNYTGKTLDGTAFDSNMDPEFNHMTPFTFILGMGQVIKGWDEGIQLLNLGAAATLYIPSGMAYGELQVGNSIPPHSVLIFDVEVVKIEKE